MADAVVTIPYRPRYPEVHDMLEKHRFVVLVAHRRFGKTVLAVNHLVKSALLCRLERGMFAYVAPYRNQAKAIVWAYLKHYAGAVPGWRVNESELSVTFPTGSVVRLFGADNPDALRGLYFDGVVLDEVAQMQPEVWSEILRPALADRQGWAVFIGTPKGINLFSELYERAKREEAAGNPDWKALLYRADETGAVPPAEMTKLRAELSDNAWRQEMLCDFTAAGDDSLIPVDLASDAAARQWSAAQLAGAPVIVGVDVARFGADATVFARRQGVAAFPPVVLRGLDNMAVADRLAAYMEEFRPDAVFVDAGGGAGVIDRLRRLGRTVVEAPFGARAVQDGKYVNRRAEMWCAMRDWLKAGGSLPDDPELKGDLAAPFYDFDPAGRLRLESKEALKARLGRSPDRGDALALTFYAPVGVRGTARTGVRTSRPAFQRWR